MENTKNFLKKEFHFGKISLSEKYLFAQHLSVMLRSGVPLLEALNILQEQAEGKFQIVLSKVLSSINAGQTLANSLARQPSVFSGLFVSMVRSGEVSGNLEKSLVNISSQLKKQEELENKIKIALLYPAIVVAIAIIVGSLMSYFVLPRIAPLLKGLTVELPLSTKILIWFSDLMKNYGLIIFGGLFLISTVLNWLRQQSFVYPFTHFCLLKFPVINKIIINSELARFSYTLSSLLSSGINIDKALEITKETLNNFYYSSSVYKIQKRVMKGNKVSKSLIDFSELYPGIFINMVRVGEKSGELDKVLLYLSNIYEKKLNDAVEYLVIIIEPLFLVIIGLLVTFLALAIITPIYEVTGNISL
jgi:type IV pilus assembly protein PilC